jgi:hypothetical protein
LLVSEKVGKLPMDDPRFGLYDLVIRKYQTLPGVQHIKLGYEPTTNAPMTTYHQLVVPGGAPQPLTTNDGTRVNGQEVIDSFLEDTDEYPEMLVIVAITMPSDVVEKKSIGFAFPAEFVFLGGWTIPPTCTIGGPYPGITHTLTQQRTASKPAEVTRSYSRFLPSVSDTWTVTSPGSADRFFGIGSNTIHNAIFLVESCGGPTQDLEDLPASTPASYDPSDELLIQTSATKWRGNLFEKVEVVVVETP